jgi:hypothetical protein
LEESGLSREVGLLSLRHQEELKLNGIYLFPVDDNGDDDVLGQIYIYIWSGRYIYIYIIKRNNEALLEASREVI